MTRFPEQKIRVWALKCLGFYIGEKAYISQGITFTVGITDTSMQFEVGKRAAIGPNVTIILASHPCYSKLQSIVKHPIRRIVIGEDTWVGANCIIMPGITIVKCCIVAAGAVVTHDVPDYTVVAGVPAKVIKRIDPSLI